MDINIFDAVKLLRNGEVISSSVNIVDEDGTGIEGFHYFEAEFYSEENDDDNDDGSIIQSFILLEEEEHWILLWIPDINNGLPNRNWKISTDVFVDLLNCYEAAIYEYNNACYDFPEKQVGHNIWQDIIWIVDLTDDKIDGDKSTDGDGEICLTSGRRIFWREDWNQWILHK